MNYTPVTIRPILQYLFANLKESCVLFIFSTFGCNSPSVWAKKRAEEEVIVISPPPLPPQHPPRPHQFLILPSSLHWGAGKCGLTGRNWQNGKRRIGLERGEGALVRAGRDPLGGEPLLAGEALRVGQRLVAGGRVGPHCFHPFSPSFQ